MVYELKLPELGENIETAVVVSLAVQVGEDVVKDQIVAELETEKATAELPSEVAGRVTEIRVKVGDELVVGQTLMLIEQGSESRSTEPSAVPGETAGPDMPPTARTNEDVVEVLARQEEDARVVQSPVPGGDVPASPATRRLARELGVNIEDVEGTGAGGRVTLDDVKTHAKELISSPKQSSQQAVPTQLASAALPGPAEVPQLPDLSKWGPVERQPMSGVRRMTARAMKKSWLVAPQVTGRDKADITELNAARQKFAPRVVAAGGKLTVTSLLLKVVGEALRRFPQFNAAVDEVNQEVVFRQYVNIGVAVDAGHGLLVPVIRDVDKKSIVELSVALSDVSRRAREKKLSIEEMRGAGFTLSNLGGLGTTDFSPIVNWPEVAILGVNRADMQPVWNGDDFKPRLILPLSLTYDHRVIDGADAARFLRFIAEAIEQPLLLVMGE